MNETPTPETDSTADTALKRRLLNRIAVAAVVMVGLLGSLAIFDALNAPPPAPATMAATAGGASPAKGEPVAAQAKAGRARRRGTRGRERSRKLRRSPRRGNNAVPEAHRIARRAAPAATAGREKRLTKPATGRTRRRCVPSEPVPPAASPAARPDPGARTGAGSRPRRGARPPRDRSPRPANASTPCRLGVFGNLVQRRGPARQARAARDSVQHRGARACRPLQVPRRRRSWPAPS
jgi:hypothetical protein